MEEQEINSEIIAVISNCLEKNTAHVRLLNERYSGIITTE
jgi:hypothetical protein